MIVFFSIVKRKRPVIESGELVKLDWDKKEIIKKIDLYPTNPDIIDDPNPRGNSRGGKGVLITKDELFAGTYHSINIYDHELCLKRKITNNLFVNIHEVCFDNSNILVSSTSIDGALKVDLNGNLIKSWWPREEKEIQKKFGISPLDINKNIDNRLIHINREVSTKEGHIHLNCITIQNDNIYLLLNKLGVLCKVEPKFEILIHDKELRGTHTLKIIDNGNYGLLCGTKQRSIIIIDLKRNKILDTIELLQFQEIKSLYSTYPDQPFNRSIFVRGLEIINKNRILVGISPASIIEIDIEKRELIDMFQYSNEVGDAVHGIAHL